MLSISLKKQYKYNLNAFCWPKNKLKLSQDYFCTCLFVLIDVFTGILLIVCIDDAFAYNYP